MSEEKENKFAVFADADGLPQPLILTHLTFARLMDDVVVPYESDEPFFIDGAAPLKKQNLKKLKIIRECDSFRRLFEDLHETMRCANIQFAKLYSEQYHIRLEALLRESGEDVTSQVLKAFDRTIRPSIRDYIPKREELIKAALAIFVESMKALSK